MPGKLWPLILAFALTGCDSDSRNRDVAPPSLETTRILSLSPGLTETLAAIGLGSRLVGRSDYCDFPPSVRRLPVAGTSLAPNFEAVARLKPEVILVEANQTSHQVELDRLGEVWALPWLSLDDVVSGTRALGLRFGAVAEAEALAARLGATLGPPPPDQGPEVLLVLGGEVDGSPLWFIRRNSLHGAALHAAGARNAVDRDIDGQANLSVEALVRLDPELIIALLPDSDTPELERSAVASRYGQLESLRAVRNGNVGAVFGGHFLRSGPRVLELVSALQGEIQRLQEAAP